MQLSNLVRWYLYDMEVIEPNKVAQQLGLAPVSKEVEEKELEESDIRMADLITFLPFIDSIAEINARVLVALQREKSQIMVDRSKGEMSLEVLEQGLTDSFRQISFTALAAAIAAGLSLGIISHGDKLFDIDEEENEQ